MSPLLAQSGHFNRADECLLLGVERTRKSNSRPTTPSANPGIVREEQAMADFKMRWAASIN
jgi:hypothetical protein